VENKVEDRTPLYALSVVQPWATLIALGLKQIETRSWYTEFRGTIAIHASAGKPDFARELCEQDSFFQEALAKHDLNFDLLPRGCIIALADLNSCQLIKGFDDKKTECVNLLNPNTLPLNEIIFGDYAEGRFAWVFDKIYRLNNNISCKGSLSLWKIPSDILNKIR
jgi:hypothetical protein